MGSKETDHGLIREEDPPVETEGSGVGRREFLKFMGAAGAVAAGVSMSESSDAATVTDSWAVLSDLTRCIGCRNCEVVCAEANGLPEPDLDDTVLDHTRNTSETQYSVINRFETDKGDVYVKHQCMHCLQPACASACLTKAMLKTKDGPVRWRESKCMGCRFCMVSCPFDIPKFEYHSRVPRIQKCMMCWERLEEGEQPVCVENCPAEAMYFGRRTEVLREARHRICEDPDNYVDHIYGEEEVGGTGWLYVAGVPFEQLGFKTNLGDTAYPKFTTGFLYGVPLVLTLFPALLLGLNKATRPEEGAEREESRDGHANR
jgi:formate dehydrogenase iron-sulfur subunit